MSLLYHFVPAFPAIIQELFDKIDVSVLYLL